jgi:hypothetical protein
MAKFFNPIQTQLLTGTDEGRPVIIEPVLRSAGNNSWEPTNVFKIYKDAFGDKTELITMPDPENRPELPDSANPDYLGKVIFEDEKWRYEGELLTENEQRELAAIILDYQEPGIDPGP